MNVIASKKLKAAIVAAALFLATCLAVVGSMVSASATTMAGCDGNAYFKANHQYKTHTTVILTYDPLDALFYTQKWHYELVMRYWYCPRGAQTDLIQFDSLVFCAMKGDNVDAPNMRGWKYDAYTSNDNQRTYHPGIQTVSWQLGAGNTGDEHCWSQGFDNNVWLWRTTHPFWNTEVWVDLALQPDDDMTFGNAYLGYENDPDVF